MFSEQLQDEVIARAGAHCFTEDPDKVATISIGEAFAGFSGASHLPDNREQRLYFGLLEILDFECCKYGDAPEGLTEEMIRAFLVDHRSQIACSLPTGLGAARGVFDFMEEAR